MSEAAKFGIRKGQIWRLKADYSYRVKIADMVRSDSVHFINRGGFLDPPLKEQVFRQTYVIDDTLLYENSIWLLNIGEPGRKIVDVSPSTVWFEEMFNNEIKSRPKKAFLQRNIYRDDDWTTRGMPDWATRGIFNDEGRKSSPAFKL